jgi:extracellular factor (EF) 3-hydroxypalmitic acid methyl ester biosynthesis protein
VNMLVGRRGDDDGDGYVQGAGRPRTARDPTGDTLDRFADAVRSATATSAAVDALAVWLSHQRSELSTEDWSSLCQRVRQHQLSAVLRTDPLTERALTKPRGYAGDAVVLDLIYRMGPAPRLTTPLAGAVHEAVRQLQVFRAADWRRRVVRDAVDAIAGHRPHARIASFAAGHLREAEDSAAVHGRAFGDYWALDQDPRSLATVSRDYGPFGVRTAVQHAGEVLAQGGLTQAPLDLITSTGLYDYLPDRTARRLTCALLRSLAPGGRLLVANATPGFRDAGFVEAIMDWSVIGRSEQEMLALIDPPAREHVRTQVFRDPDDVFVFLAVESVGSS